MYAPANLTNSFLFVAPAFGARAKIMELKNFYLSKDGGIAIFFHLLDGREEMTPLSQSLNFSIAAGER